MRRVAFFLAVLVLPLSVTADIIDDLVLSRMGVAEILKFLSAYDQEKGYAEHQIAAKYILGEVPAQDVEPPARVILRWRSMRLSDQKQLKVVWFREHFRRHTVEEVRKHVSVDYLIERANEEFRENPLMKSKPPEEPKPDLTAKGKKIKKDLTKAKQSSQKTPKVGTDTGTKKPAAKPKKKKETVAALKPPPDPQSPSTAPGPVPSKPTIKTKESSDKPATAETILKKLPTWQGIPTNIKNE